MAGAVLHHVPHLASQPDRANASGGPYRRRNDPHKGNRALRAGTNEAGEVEGGGQQARFQLDPVVDGDLFRAEADARVAPTGCVLGRDLAYGLGSGTDSDFFETQDEDLFTLFALNDDDPPRAVPQSVSRTWVVPSSNGPGFGLVSETRQTIAPVTFFKGDDEREMTVEPCLTAASYRGAARDDTVSVG